MIWGKKHPFSLISLILECYFPSVLHLHSSQPPTSSKCSSETCFDPAWGSSGVPPKSISTIDPLQSDDTGNLTEIVLQIVLFLEQIFVLFQKGQSESETLWGSVVWISFLELYIDSPIVMLHYQCAECICYHPWLAYECSHFVESAFNDEPVQSI